MDSIRIGTWNIKNNYFNLRKNNRKIVAIKELLNRTNLDVLALQEVSGTLLSKLEHELELSNYHLDRYLYRNNPLMPTPLEIHNIVVIKDSFINNADIIKLKTLNSKCNIFDLTALQHRYVEKVYIKDEKDSSNCFELYNVNLDSRVETNYMQIGSLAECLNENSNSNPMIVMGSLNIYSSSIEMARLRHGALNKNNLRVVNIKCPTVKCSLEEEATDHVIVPKDYTVEEVNVVRDYENVSSHYPVIAKIKIK